MDKDTRTRYTIGMVILNLEIVNRHRCFEDFVLHLLNNDIVTVDQDQNITSTKMYRICPALDRGIEWMCRCADDFLSVYMEMNQFIRFVDIDSTTCFSATSPVSSSQAHNIVPGFDVRKRKP